MISDRDRAALHDLLIQELEDFAVFLVSLDGRITTWNPGVQRFLGYRETEFIGRPVSDIFTPEDRAAHVPEREMERARSNGRSADVRWHLRNDQGRVFVEGLFLAIKDETSEIVGFAKIARAVHQRHVAGDILATILEGTEDAIYALDREGRFAFANTQAARLLGHSVEELIGERQQDLLPPTLAADLRATDESVMHGGHPQLVEEELPSERGSRAILTSKAPWRDSTGHIIGLVAIAKEITARKAYQTERDRLLREVRRSNEELSAFSHVVAHDLRAPLRAAKLHAELLAQQLADRLDDRSRQLMRFIRESAEDMEQLIESLLRYAEGGEELELRRVNVNDLTDLLLRRLEPLIQQTKTTITRNALPDVDADPVRFLQLFQNLVMNAINYRGVEPARIHISGEVLREEYRFTVTDNGIGIAREHFELIFAPLKRLHGKDIPGSGIGLALCRKIVERHGGRMWVESQVGKGSTFFFTLPMLRE